MTFEAFYLPAATGQRFCLFHQPEAHTAWRGALVYVHPFAEEMNKSRRMAALQARALALAGYAVLLIDLQGCGDSSGDFGDATWKSWVEDARLACVWLQQRSDAGLWLWGLRTGCLLACAAATRISQPSKLLLRQPVVSGKQFLQQFLRLKIAGEIFGGDNKGSKSLMDRQRDQLTKGVSVEIAGYLLSSALANGLERAELSPSAQSSAQIEWIELSSRPDAGMFPWPARGLRSGSRLDLQHEALWFAALHSGKQPRLPSARHCLRQVFWRCQRTFPHYFHRRSSGFRGCRRATIGNRC